MLTLNQQFAVDNFVFFGDKSITHRALILASISQGTTVIYNASLCQDCMSTIHCLSALGAKFELSNTTITVTPIDSIVQHRVTLNCNNSGTTARLLAGLCVGLDIEADFVGDSSLSSRPMYSVIQPLIAMGGNIIARCGCLFATRRRKGQLVGICHNLQVASAQVKSAVAIAALFANGSTTIIQPLATRNHTELMMQYLGGDVSVSDNVITLSPSKLVAREIVVPNDISSAIYPIVASIIDNRELQLYNVGVNPTRIACIEILQQCGIDVTIINNKLFNNERVADILLRGGKAKPMHIDIQQSAIAIDELLPLSVIASMTEGISTFCGVQQLLYKESNRIKQIIDICNCIGGNAQYSDGVLTIAGRLCPQQGRHWITTQGDHRVAMTAVLVAIATGRATMDNYQCIDVSCPTFFALMGIQYTKYCLIGGSQCSNSLSPYIHATLATKLDNNCCYDIIANDNLTDDDMLSIFAQYSGCNVTMPYKERVAKLLASNIDSANTVYNGLAISTDGYGAIAALTTAGIDIVGNNILLIGAGGASSAVAHSIVRKGGKVNIVNRTASRATQLTNQLGIDYKLPTVDVVISCVPNCQYAVQIVSNLANKPRYVMSLYYKADNMLQDYCQINNIPFQNGLAMLYYQASMSHGLWTSTEPQDDIDSFGRLYNETFGT